MTQEQFYNKTDECVSKFKNGKERYRTSAQFNLVIQMLARGADLYEIIDQLCQSNDDLQNAFQQYIHRDTRPMISTPDPCAKTQTP